MHAYFVLGASRVRQVSMYVLPVILQPTRACGQSRSQEDVKIDIQKLHGTIRFESKILHNALGTTTQRESRSDRSSRTARRIPSSTKGPPKTLENQQLRHVTEELRRTSNSDTPATSRPRCCQNQKHQHDLGHQTVDLMRASTTSDTSPRKQVAPETSLLSTRT